MNKSELPDWASKYCDIGFSENWIEPVFSKYSDDLLNSISKDLSPVLYVNIDFANLSDEPLSKFPDPPDNHTFTEVVLVVFDTINEFSNNIPKKDKELYSMYEEMQDNKRFDITDNFPEFYRFCRQIQHNNITSINQYERLNKTYKHYLNQDQEQPQRGSDWIINFNEEEYKVKVQGENPIVDDELASPELYCQVIEVLSEDAEEFDIGDFVELPPSCFSEKID